MPLINPAKLTETYTTTFFLPSSQTTSYVVPISNLLMTDGNGGTFFTTNIIPPDLNLSSLFVLRSISTNSTFSGFVSAAQMIVQHLSVNSLTVFGQSTLTVTGQAFFTGNTSMSNVTMSGTLYMSTGNNIVSLETKYISSQKLQTSSLTLVDESQSNLLGYNLKAFSSLLYFNEQPIITGTNPIYNNLTAAVANFSTAVVSSLAGYNGSLDYLFVNMLSTNTTQANTVNLVDTLGGIEKYPLYVVGDTLYFSNAPIGGGGTSGIVAADLYSTTRGLGTANYISSSQLTSTVAGIGVDPTVFNSTVAGLGSANYISSTQLTSTVAGIGVDPTVFNSTVAGLGSANYISSTQLMSTVAGIGVDPTFFTSTTRGLGSAGYISSTQLTSSMSGLGSAGYISSSQLTSTVAGIGADPTSFTSTTRGLGSAGYISSSQLTSTVTGLGSGLTTANLTSTVAGLGTASYISSAQLTSTVTGLGSGLTTANLTSTVAGLGTASYISSAQLTSTVTGLGSGLTTANLTSTVAGLGTASYISSAQLTSTVRNLGFAFYVSTSQITSTVAGLGASFYVSTTQLNSTTAGLGTAGYISTSQLTSTVATLQLGNTGPTGPTGFTGATGPTGPIVYYTFDGGDPTTTYTVGPAFDCGAITVGQNIQFQFRRGTSTQWSNANTVLASGEPGLDTTVNNFKLGNGATVWNDLPYADYMTTVYTMSTLTVNGLTTVRQITEVVSTYTNPQGTVNFDFNHGAIFYISSMTSNFTANFSNVPTTANRSLVTTLMLQQSTNSANYTSTIRINSSTPVLRWPNATAPTPTSNRTEMESFTIYGNGINTWYVMGQLTSFG